MALKMVLGSVLLLYVSLLSYQEVLAINCVNVATSEGITTLHHGEHACAPLIAGETDSQKGRRFLTCNNGDLLTQECTPGLSFDTRTLGCNWPNLGTCAIPDNGNVTPDPNQPVIQTTPTPAPGPNDCDPANCSLPNCFCYGALPTSVPKDKQPMFIMLTFDDGITAALYQSYYRELFLDDTYGIKNPSGCKPKSTYYVIDANTDYSKLKTLADAGQEIASHTIHHILAQGDKASDFKNISDEIDGIRKIVLNVTGDKSISDSMVGFRAPYLRVAGNVMFDALQSNNFLYDTSIVNTRTYSGKKPVWPFTLDYVLKECVNPPCPTKPYNGLWEVPLNGWMGDNGFSCGMIDACIVGQDVFNANVTEWYNYYDRNFKTYFYEDRIPMHMFTHASLFLRSPDSYPGMVQWFQNVTEAYDNVWLVTPTQVINWMKNQTSNADMIKEKWGC